MRRALHVRFTDLVKNKFLYLLVLPGLIYFLLFSYLPMAGIVIAFKEYRMDLGIFGSPFNGLNNFKFLTVDTLSVLRVVFNTLFLNVLFIGIGTALAVITAVLINEIRLVWFKKISQSLVILPNFISWVIVAVFAYNFLNTDFGIVNNWLKNLGLEGVSWYNQAGYWPAILVLLYSWKSVGFNSIIYLAAITGIDQEQYESAALDGANKFRQIWHITIPGISKTIIILLLLAIGRIFYGDFGMIYGLVGDNSLLFSTTDVIDTYVFRALRTLNDVGMSSAIGLLQSVIGFLFVYTANAVVRKYDKDAALF
ncbi:ABC transporter permease [Paenibacillus lutimineralis]|uniref:Sugar ABC transporter permease n=1 Tax=Paenibacillus lutimineralis TaxID=2707005 RepID=A0A3S9V3B7_9BACL|nr:ABC transporter permease subunit [Paenibacillus lutimineralis]AZS17000.1 sugar ABC transporter permease [Paenibacillus lutimineralis]